jgi:hypothetical protein
MYRSLLAIIAALALFSCNQQKQNAPESTAFTSKADMIKRGKYLVTIGACHDCHSPKVKSAGGLQLDTTRLLSGHPMDEQVPPIAKTNDWILFGTGLTSFVGPWGVSYSANLTPDETGIGNWTFDQFKVAIQKGKSKGLVNNRPLLPPMPWEMYRNMTEEDLKSVFTYLKSIKPVRNIVPAPQSPESINTFASK